MSYRVTRSPAVVCIVLWFCTMVLGIWSGRQRAGADEPDRLANWLAAGEYAPAIEWARQQPQRSRDAALARIAQAQSSEGAWYAARRSAAEIASGATAKELLLSGGGTGQRGAAGGGVVADFNTLMTLIQEVIDPDTWEENGGNGRMSPFPLGVMVDARGVLHIPLERPATTRLDEAARAARSDRGNRDARTAVALRKVSLNRLERQLLWRRARGLGPTSEMQHLAGIYRITHLFIYPETGDIVIAGPADDWQLDPTGRAVSRTTREPTLWLDDFIVVWRNAVRGGGRFWCSIEPDAARLRRTADLMKGEKHRTGLRSEWLKRIRASLGKQTIVVRGIDPQSRAARVIVEADYRMKRIGIGIDESVFGVPSYFDLLAQGPLPKQMGVLRWWFRLAPSKTQANASRTAFRLPRRPVELQSENPKLAADGTQRHTGESSHHNRRFAAFFTQHYDRIEARYPVFSDLRNVMQWALVAALLRNAQMESRTEWRGSYFLDEAECPIVRDVPLKEVDSIVNERKIGKGRYVTAVSGGVMIDAHSWLGRDGAIERDQYDRVTASRHRAARREALPPDVWWWD